MSRRHREELSFGSDSFLDVIANIVGILIILIVAMGVYVSKSALNAVTQSTTEERDEEQQTASPALASFLGENAVSVRPSHQSRQAVPFDVAVPLPDLIDNETDENWTEQLLQLEKSIQELEKQEGELKRQAELAKQNNQQEALTQSELAQLVAEKESQVAAEAEQLKELEDHHTVLVSKLMQMKQKQQEQAQASIVEKTVELRHQLPPIGRVVEGPEVHFCLSENRISLIPIDSLVDEVKRDLERRKQILLTRPFYQGTTVAVGGYRMEYLIQRMGRSLAEEIRYGQGMVQVGVTRWIVRPTSDLVAETADEALTTGSRFLQELQRHGTSATVTFWVYPDSFELHRELKSQIQPYGFWVASRPLPEGAPIAGSPQGSKSVAQ